MLCTADTNNLVALVLDAFVLAAVVQHQLFAARYRRLVIIINPDEFKRKGWMVVTMLHTVL
jgi:hypothetical protein